MMIIKSLVIIVALILCILWSSREDETWPNRIINFMSGALGIVIIISLYRLNSQTTLSVLERFIQIFGVVIAFVLIDSLVDSWSASSATIVIFISLLLFSAVSVFQFFVMPNNKAEAGALQ